MRAGISRTVMTLTIAACLAALLVETGCRRRGLRFRPRASGGSSSVDRDAQRVQEEMAAASAQAAASIDSFIDRVMKPQAGDGDFAVRKRFRGPGGTSEQLWLRGVTYEPRTQEFFGVLDSDPDYVTGVKKGSRLKCRPEEATDWMLISKGKLVGGFTIRVMRRNLATDAERAEFDKAFGATIDEE